MIRKYECTDCSHCVSFEDGYRLICANPNLTPDAVCNYLPVGEGNAAECKGFAEGIPTEFSYDQFSEAQSYSEKHFPEEETLYPGIFAWVQEELKKDNL